MATNTDLPSKGRRIYVFAAWASPLAALAIAGVFWLWIASHQGTRGERQPAVLLFYVILLAASALAGLAGVFGLFGIRSWSNALLIVPGTLLGVGLSGCNIVMCLLAYALEGRNLGG
jgi:hypothetical protein